MADLPGRILAIDYGSRKVGLALSDPMRILTSGAGTIDHDDGLIDEIAQRVSAEAVRLIVVGMPYGPDGGQGGKAEEVLQFIQQLRLKVSVPVETWDESYTSEKAKELFRTTGMKKKQRREKRRVDEMAARILLQEYMENRVNR